MRAIVGALIVLFSASLSMRAALAQDNETIAAGERVYNNYCFTCHGEKLVSTRQTFDLRRLRADERPRFENSVNNGKVQMPPWKGVLGNDEIDQLWNFICANANER